VGIAVVAVVAGLASVVAGGGSGGDAPAPVVWRDHVVDSTMTSTR